MIVYQEVATRGLELGQPDAYALQMAVARNELVVGSVNLDETPTGQEATLQLGERAVIHLAGLEAADWVLFDDQLARDLAFRSGLHVKGTLGIILEAHHHNLLTADEVELVFEAILNRDDIWISDTLVRRVRDAWRLKTATNR